MLSTYSLHCSSFFGCNHIDIKDPIRYPPKRNYNGDSRHSLVSIDIWKALELNDLRNWRVKGIRKGAMLLGCVLSGICFYVPWPTTVSSTSGVLWKVSGLTHQSACFSRSRSSHLKSPKPYKP